MTPVMSPRTPEPTTARLSSTTSPPPMKRISRWPARMLAKSRTLRLTRRAECEMTSMKKVGVRGGPSTPGGGRALGADALDVVADPHHHGEHERDGEVGRRRVEREARHLQAEDVHLVLGVRRQREVADDVREPDEQEDGPDEGEPLRGHPVVHVAARDVVAHEC